MRMNKINIDYTYTSDASFDGTAELRHWRRFSSCSKGSAASPFSKASFAPCPTATNIHQIYSEKVEEVRYCCSAALSLGSCQRLYLSAAKNGPGRSQAPVRTDSGCDGLGALDGASLPVPDSRSDSLSPPRRLRLVPPSPSPSPGRRRCRPVPVPVPLRYGGTAGELCGIARLGYAVAGTWPWTCQHRAWARA